MNKSKLLITKNPTFEMNKFKLFISKNQIFEVNKSKLFILKWTIWICSFQKLDFLKWTIWICLFQKLDFLKWTIWICSIVAMVPCTTCCQWSSPSVSQHRGDARGYGGIKRYFSSIQKASDILHGRGRHVSLTEAQGGCQDLQGRPASRPTSRWTWTWMPLGSSWPISTRTGGMS